MLETHERRRAARVPCRLPVRLVRGGHVTYGVTEDLSRAGALVRIPLAALDLEPGLDLAGVARRLDQRLGEAFVAEFCWQTLGSLVRKVLRVARVARVDGDAGVVDLGCELRVPLDALETEALGVGLPPLAPSVPAELFPAPPVSDEALSAAVAEDEARTRCARRRAVLMPSREHRRAPLLAEAHSMTANGLLVALGTPQRLGLPLERLDATGLLLAFDARFGSNLGVLLMEGDEPLWSGQSHVDGLELRRGENRLLLNVSLSSPLEREEAVRLGLA